MKSVLLFFLFIYSGRCFAQRIISGIIEDSTGKKITGASVTIYEIGKKAIATYGLTSSNGSFRLNINNVKGDSILLKVSHISYKPYEVEVANKSFNYNFVLRSEFNSLPDIVTKAYRSPITQSKDSINYNVSAFTAKQDRVIGDIIKKLPGIEMDGDKILYNGKQLKKYYINGIDLMQGRYGIINNSIPADAILKIQLIENDQPIKILDSILPSDQASLNLVTKRFSTSGSGGIGFGVTPFLWDLSLTPIVVSKKWQMLNSFQSNNTGNDVSDQLNVLTSEKNPGDSATRRYIDVHTVPNLPFDKTKWLQNNIKMYNSSLVFQTKNNWNINGSLRYVNDYQVSEDYKRSNLITYNKNLTIIEQTSNRYNTNDLSGNLSIEKNEANFHLKEKFDVGKKWDYYNTMNLRNDTSQIKEIANMESSYVSNDLNIITKWGKQLISISSTTTYGVGPQVLDVSPGQFIGFLNDSIPYNNATQNIQYKRFKTDNSFGLTKNILGLYLNFNTGFSFQSEQLQSDLKIDGESKGNLFSNNMHYLHPRIYLNTNLHYQLDKLSASLLVPLSWETFRANYDQQPSDSTQISTLILSPVLFIELPLGDKWQLHLSSNYSEDYGNQSDNYLSYILGSYSNLSRSNSLNVAHSNTWSSEISANFKDLLTTRFGGVTFFYRKTHNDFINQIYLDTLGFYYQNLIPLENNSSSTNIEGHISQFFSNIKSTVKVSASWNYIVSDQLINDEFSPMKSNSIAANLQINSSLGKWISVGYEGGYNFSKTTYPDRKLDDISSQHHHIEVNTFPFKLQMLSIYSDYYVNNLKYEHNQHFLNMKYTFTLPKSRTDFSISWNNILNTKKFITQYNNAYSSVYRELYLRPSQVLVSAKFYFK